MKLWTHCAYSRKIAPVLNIFCMSKCLFICPVTLTFLRAGVAVQGPLVIQINCIDVFGSISVAAKTPEPAKFYSDPYCVSISCTCIHKLARMRRPCEPLLSSWAHWRPCESVGWPETPPWNTSGQLAQPSSCPPQRSQSSIEWVRHRHRAHGNSLMFPLRSGH